MVTQNKVQVSKSLERLLALSLVGVQAINLSRAKIKTTDDVVSYIQNSSRLAFDDIYNTVRVV